MAERRTTAAELGWHVAVLRAVMADEGLGRLHGEAETALASLESAHLDREREVRVPEGGPGDIALWLVLAELRSARHPALEAEPAEHEVRAWLLEKDERHRSWRRERVRRDAWLLAREARADLEAGERPVRRSCAERAGVPRSRVPAAWAEALAQAGRASLEPEPPEPARDPCEGMTLFGQGAAS